MTATAIATLTASARGKTIRFEVQSGQPMTIGRSSRCSVRLRDAKVSRQHCQVSFVDGKLIVTDLGSTQGVQFRGQRCAQFELEVGDGFHVGETYVRRMTHAAADPVAPAAGPAMSLASVETIARELKPGTQYGSYVVGAVLGRSDRCTVYEAESRLIGKKVALKILHRGSGGALAAADQAAFLADARTAASIAHPLFVQVLEAGGVGVHCHAAMEHLEDGSLQALLERRGPCAWSAALPILCDLLDALEHLHERGLVHGGLKPANVFPVEGGALLGDPRALPVARPLESPGFQAPEVTGTAVASRRSDFYALGCLAYAALTGKSPAGDAAGGNPAVAPSHLMLVANGLPQPIAEFLCSQLLAVDPEDRPSSAAQIRAALLQEDEDPAAKTCADLDDAAAGLASLDSAARSRRPAPSWGVQMSARLTGQLIVFSIHVLVVIGLLLTLKLKWPDCDIYHLLDWLREQRH